MEGSRAKRFLGLFTAGKDFAEDRAPQHATTVAGLFGVGATRPRAVEASIFLAGVLGVLFVAGQLLIGLYLEQVAPGSQYGAAGTVVTVLWLCCSGLMFFYGAEVTQAYTNAHGRIRPDEDAVRPSSRTNPTRR